MKRIVTPSQTVGPYLHLGLAPVHLLPSPDIPGERVTLTGRVLDGTGTPVNDGMIELWQANSRGKYDHPEDDQDKQTTPGFSGFGRVYTDGRGGFSVETIKPGPVPWIEGGEQAPHINVSVFARGVLKRLATRVYFADEPATAHDPVLARIADEARRETLIAQPDPRTGGAYLWNIVLQGAHETVFFDL